MNYEKKETGNKKIQIHFLVLDLTDINHLSNHLFFFSKNNYKSNSRGIYSKFLISSWSVIITLQNDTMTLDPTWNSTQDWLCGLQDPVQNETTALLSVGALRWPGTILLDSAHSGLLKDIALQSPFYLPAAWTALALSYPFHHHQNLQCHLPVKDKQTTQNALGPITYLSCLLISVSPFIMEATQHWYPDWLEEYLGQIPWQQSQDFNHTQPLMWLFWSRAYSMARWIPHLPAHRWVSCDGVDNPFLT